MLLPDCKPMIHWNSLLLHRFWQCFRTGNTGACNGNTKRARLDLPSIWILKKKGLLTSSVRVLRQVTQILWWFKEEICLLFLVCFLFLLFVSSLHFSLYQFISAEAPAYPLSRSLLQLEPSFKRVQAIAIQIYRGYCMDNVNMVR